MIDTGQENRSEEPGHFLDELRATFAARAGRPAILYKDASWTYGDLDAKARRCAGRLRQLGVEPGDRVAVITSEKLPFLAAHLGTLYSGAISLPLNPRFTADELRYFLQDSGTRVVVAGQDEQPVIESLRGELPELSGLLSDAEAWDAPAAPFSGPTIDREAGCLMLYSSGTTGRPKGVLHNHANLASSLRALQACWQFTPEDVLVNVMPLFHIHGLSFATHLSLLTGCRMLVEDTFHPRRTLEVVERGTVFMAIPTFYYTFLDRPEFHTVAQRWSGVRLFTCGSAPIRPEVLPELESILGRPVINRYGMTEAHVITSLPIGGPWPRGSVGLPLNGIDVRVVDENGAPVGPDQVGSVRLRGPNLFPEYWRRPDATREAFASGWFDTGDLGFRDAGGFLTLVARKNDLIISNGFNVYPQVVERVINECPGVRESAVVGLPDRKRGERVVAAVVRSDAALTEHTLRAYLVDRLVDYQRPADIIFVPALPRNAMGKVLRPEFAINFRSGKDGSMIDLAWISLAALVVVIVLSCTTSVNPGFLSLSLAWVIGIYLAPAWGRHFTMGELLGGFPTDLFLTLVGVSLLFTLARGNGTLDRVVHLAVRGCRGNTGLIPILFFGLSCVIASIGAGNIATAALIAPLAMAVADRARIPAFLMTIMVAHGCIAGALSPIAPTGIIANGLMARMSLSGFERQNYLANLLANAAVAALGYLAFGGWRLFGQPHEDEPAEGVTGDPDRAMTFQHRATLATIVVLVVGVVGFRVHVGMGAFAAAVALTLAKLTDERPVIPTLPWSVIMMVCGVTVLTSLLEKIGGIDLFTTILARFATQRSVNGLIAFLTGLISVYSSTSGVVLPAFLPSVPGLVGKLGGGDPLAIASSILIGGHLVDVSPLSPVGALCIASAPITADRRLLFNQVMIWGLSMSVVGALGCYLAFG